MTGPRRIHASEPLKQEDTGEALKGQCNHSRGR